MSMFDASNQNGTARVTNLFDHSLLVDLPLERDILGTLALKPHLIEACNLVERDFEGAAHRTLFTAILEVYQNEGTCDSTRLRAHLLDTNKLQRAGGEDTLRDLFDNVLPDSALPNGRLVPGRLKRLAILRRLRNTLLFHAKNIHEPEAAAKYEAEADRYRAELRALDQTTGPSEHRLDAMWKSLGEWGMLDTQPEPQDWVLLRPDTDSNGMGNPVGLLPRSEVGFILGPGGLGKSIACAQLALSVATGRKWLDYFPVQRPGNVLLILGEEKLKQAHRRFYELGRSMRLTDQQLAEARQRVVLMPLSGVIAPFVHQDGKTTTETDVMPWLRQRMAGTEWTLVIIDPVSRFAGVDTEKDNVQATRFVQVAESLCSMPGAPTVLLVHHSNKTSRGEDAGRPSTSDARGATALTDGARWCANLARRQSGGVSLHFTKNNYGTEWDETIALERAFGGYLRVESQETQARREHERDLAREAKEAELRERILKYLGKHPGKNKGEVRDALGGDRTAVFRVIAEMAGDGLLVEHPKNSFRVATAQGGLDV